MSSPTLTASSAMPSGTRLGEFEITGVIGEGGFGIVYSARDSSLDRIVAIKEYLPSAFASRTTAGTVQVRSLEHSSTFDAGLSSFINEARMLAKFSHPGLVEVFRFWEANGTAYMAMRYYRGVTLREMLRTNPQIVTEQWLCETLDPILLALQELHNEKCYHRDIAPDNILVLPNGRSVLMDFGAARRIIGGMTRALTTVLKPGYAPIEQYSDDGSMAQGAWTDIYAIGGLLYHAMTGKVPVQAISRMMNDPLKPVAVAARSDFSPNLCAVVMKCLSVMPENRYQTIDELRAALGWVTTPVSSTVMLQRPSPPLPSQTSSAAPASSSALPANVSLIADAAVAKVDPLPQVNVPVPGSDILADLLGTSSSPTKPSAPAPIAAPSKVTAPVPGATQQRRAGDGSEQPKPAIEKPVVKPPEKSGQSKSNVLPMAIVGVALVAVIGSAAFLFFGKAGSDDVREKPVASVPAVESKTEPTSPPPTATLPPVSPPVVTDTPPASQSEPARPAETAAPSSSDIASAKPGDMGSKGLTPASGVVGKVDLRIKPWGTISVNGAAKITSPPTMNLQLPPGTYTIEIQNPAGPTVSKTVEVVAGKSVTVRHSF
jgi:non-specific serine/threonine protein kinase